MLAPIITKDMKLFPSRPLPPGVKNVRSRAQSLDQFTEVQNSQSMRGRIVPVKPRVSQSMGNLPSSAQKSPPKVYAQRKTTLSAIQEGVEMEGAETSSSQPRQPTGRASQRRTAQNGNPAKNDKKDKGKENDVAKPNPKLNAWLFSCGCIAAKEARCSAQVPSADPLVEHVEHNEKKGVVRWLTNALRNRSKSDSSSNKDKDSMSTNSS